MSEMGIALLHRLYLIEVQGKWEQVHCAEHRAWEGRGWHPP